LIPRHRRAVDGTLTIAGQAAREANRVEVAFDTIAPTDEEFWSERSDNDLHVPIGRWAQPPSNASAGPGRGAARFDCGQNRFGQIDIAAYADTNLAMCMRRISRVLSGGF